MISSKVSIMQWKMSVLGFVVRCRAPAIRSFLGKGGLLYRGTSTPTHLSPVGGVAPALAFCFRTASRVSRARISSMVFGSTSASMS